MGYYIDLAAITIDKYKEILKTDDLLPSWQILRVDVDKNMDILKDHGILNLDQLKTTLKKKSDVQAFSDKTGISIAYLIVLRRVINGYHPKPNRFKDFPNVDDNIAAQLEDAGYKHSLHFYPDVLTAAKRSELANKTGIGSQEILKLTKLTDLSRVKWVNHTFAYVLMECGYDTAEKVATADYNEMYQTVKRLNAERHFFPAHIGAKDMSRCVEAAQRLDFEIEYQKD